ncbi:MAG: hypothetical protein LBC02_09170 [Planctomycetaceae bacterium]|nr:hypothetical protein [Planctomycetaceae bacterium]
MTILIKIYFVLKGHCITTRRNTVGCYALPRWGGGILHTNDKNRYDNKLHTSSKNR